MLSLGILILYSSMDGAESSSYRMKIEYAKHTYLLTQWNIT